MDQYESDFTTRICSPELITNLLINVLLHLSVLLIEN